MVTSTPHRVGALLVGLSIATASSLHASERVAAASQAFQQVQDNPELRGVPRAKAIEDSYTRLFSRFESVDLATLDDGDLPVLFGDAYTAAFYSKQPRHVDRMAALAGELVRRGIATPAQWRDLFQGYVLVRQFDRAEQIRTAHPAVGAPVPSVDALPAKIAGPSLWTVADGGRRLVERRVDLRDTSILVIADPGCSFTQWAARDLAQDAALSAALGSAQWIVPQTGDLDARAVAAWNAEHPAFAMSYVVNEREWPMVATWETPTFVFLRDGAVVHEVVGWPKAGRKAELQTGLDALR
ncbi:MAG: hypothetical protein NVV68_07375 [Dokdonella sp.]|nr:hypothetical protein [Dokdonella sp.]